MGWNGLPIPSSMAAEVWEWVSNFISYFIMCVITYPCWIRVKTIHMCSSLFMIALADVMAWCHQASSHYLSQCWLGSLIAYVFTKLQCIKNNIPWINSEIKQYNFLLSRYLWLLTVSYTSKRNCLLTHWGQDKMAPIFQMTFFKFIFLNENI